MLRLFVGLGNPGAEYDDTRHNAGFAWVDAVARELKVTLQPERSYFGLVARANLPQGPVWLLQPQTYMNLSGKSVAALARFFKIEPNEILVAHDELDLAPGEMKLKQGGGTGGHNGLKDMQAQLGSADFWRLRLGIGHPGHKGEVAGYVLRRAPAPERDALQDCIHKSLPVLPLLLAGEMDKALQRLHAKPQRPKPPKPAVPPKVADAAAPPPSATEPAP
jgi:peptidyl-tRNA hydrolase, PTH1 family